MRNSRWKLTLPLDEALKNKNDVVALADSQMLRFIDDINGVEDYSDKVIDIKKQIKDIKKLPKSHENKQKISELYSQLYELQFQEDYVCIVMDKLQDYDRANKGFEINGIKYKRFLGTNGGIKRSTIVYVSEKVYPELKRRMDNGRNLDKKLVPAKLEAYQALICSGSIPVSFPKGVIVVSDIVTNFKADIININDENDGEPQLTKEENKDCELMDSDGYGLMLPSYSRRINGELNGDYNNTITGVNTRYAWTKGMLFTFDFLDFAESVAKKYIITDAWGHQRDVRKAEVILTTSMVKLWDSYNSWEDFYENCKSNNYQFSVAGKTPKELGNVRNMNYQFLQSYDFTDDELYELCKPTIDEIRDILGMDYRKSLLFLKGMYLDDDNIDYVDLDFAKALMIDKRMINDPFVKDNIYKMIKKRIVMAKKSSITVNGNFAIVSGDPYTLCEHIFGLKVKGLLEANQTYHKYWIDKGVKEIVCFRAPMTCHNNIRKLNVTTSKDMERWYKHMKTCQILNSWDTTCDALNGEDKDSDENFTTDNPILLKNTKNLPAIQCVQRNVDKVIPTEENIIESNKLSFGDEIGFTTNITTSQFNVQAQFSKDSDEYKELEYRIMCGQLFQQNAIDKAKGIIAKPIPKEWYDRRANIIKKDDSEEVKQKKRFNMSIVADKKPYFMRYIYPKTNQEYERYIKNNNIKSLREFRITLDELLAKKDRSKKEDRFVHYYYMRMPVGINPCISNRICWIFEKEFDDYNDIKNDDSEFDYNILKSGVQYSKNDYDKIKQLYSEYILSLQAYHYYARRERLEKDEVALNRELLKNNFKANCEMICSNEKELCDIVLDICYTTNKSKQFAWDVCGDVIIENLLEKNNYVINYPTQDESGDVEFNGFRFSMVQKQVKEVDDILV